MMGVKKTKLDQLVQINAIDYMSLLTSFILSFAFSKPRNPTFQRSYWLRSTSTESVWLTLRQRLVPGKFHPRFWVFKRNQRVLLFFLTRTSWPPTPSQRSPTGAAETPTFISPSAIWSEEANCFVKPLWWVTAHALFNFLKPLIDIINSPAPQTNQRSCEDCPKCPLCW